ncbi:probable receptor-like protein kinase At5g20050 [Amaranthus tricolor]|uniref:probable receptor-like protein kinase At5g20050 n=1 Tax=Amaranthus tricolor TaxID=29722 RepID=UPI0025905A81|nr:probable receptor-like protein kinase At5g20050 [Amaranthus tricolor]
MLEKESLIRNEERGTKITFSFQLHFRIAFRVIMDDKKSKILALILVVTLILLITVSALYLGPTWQFFCIFGACILVTFSVFIWLIRRQSKSGAHDILPQKHVMSRELSVPCSFLRKVAGVPTKFRQKELELATDNFNALIGRGASGSVFKGILGDGTCVAVKRIESQERGEKEFLSEVAAIGSVQHINLVRLYGYCIVPAGPRFLVYEFIQNGSLDGWIFPRRDRRNRPGGCLPWHLRYSVAIDVAKALSYLHHDCRSRILHLDVKPENILLDDNYRAVVSDFGLAKLMARDESRIITNIRGTKGYLAPEWLLENGISAKSDVYSYGMVLLEMIGGRRSVRVLDDSKDRSLRKYEYFPKLVVEKLKEGKLMSVVDQRLLEGRHIDERQVRTLVYIALWCIQEKVRRRPTMAQVVDMLEGHLRIDEPPETEMIIVDLLSIDKDKGAGKNRFKATGVVLSDCHTAASSSHLEPGTVLTGR